jgi:DNA-binding NarL/FixJ family response regulator
MHTANSLGCAPVACLGHLPSWKPTILLADEQTLMVLGLQRLLELQFDVVGSVNDGNDLIAQTRALRPKIVLTEIPLRGISGIEAARELRELRPHTKVIFVTERAETSYVHQALRAGASGYILKRCTSDELHAAIHKVLAGQTYLAPELKRVPEFESELSLLRSKVGVLTFREREVLKLVVQGHSARTIAAVLHISEKTVAFHKHNLRQKLSVRTAAEMATFVSQNSAVVMLPRRDEAVSTI